MFIQIIQGKCTRQDELHALIDNWRTELGPTAAGWLGGTYGFTDDDEFIGVVRFDSRESAMANSNRPEQSAWAEKFAACMDGPITYHDCDDVTLLMDGGSDDAGFVQVIQGKLSDPSMAKSLFADTDTLHQMRPDIIGATMAIEADGSFTETVAFTSETAARDGEQKEPPEEVKTLLDRMLAGAKFYDLHHPWFASAAR